ncbi:MAG: L-glyceraldehyde 3-phosphate reductase [Chitinophagaceae bacterium]|nr:L-glyceraldehyde 3-phosphate reductase [Chitinophagaceae bacterium]
MHYTANSERYKTMEYRRCGKSGLKLPAISLGLWHNFGYVDPFANQLEIIKTSFDNGITHFDLANNYGPPSGAAEENFGKILHQNFKKYRDEMIISTKAGYYMWEGPYGDFGSKKYLISSLDQSLKRMKIDYVDIFYHHRFDADTPLEETMGTLHSIVQQGKALYIGISNYKAKDSERAFEILTKLGVKCTIHQPKYSLLNRWVESELLDILYKNGVGCIPFSPLAQGLLTNKYITSIPQDSRAYKPTGFLKQEEVNNEVMEKIKKLNDIAQKRNQTLAQMSLGWLLKNPNITSVLIGVSKVTQLIDCLGALQNYNFTQEEIDSIDQVVKH